MGRNFLTQGRPGARVRNVRGKSGPKSLCLCCFFFPDTHLICVCLKHLLYDFFRGALGLGISVDIFVYTPVWIFVNTFVREFVGQISRFACSVLVWRIEHKRDKPFFPQTFRAPPGYPGKIPGYPAKQFGFPEFQRTYQTFWPPPLHVEALHPKRRFPDQESWVWVPFSSLNSTDFSPVLSRCKLGWIRANKKTGKKNKTWLKSGPRGALAIGFY